MKADTGRRYRLYPTPDAEWRLQAWGHTARALWNVALHQRLYVYEQRGKALHSGEQSRYLTAARGEVDWLAELPAQAAQQVLRQLDTAYDNFWNPSHPAGFPQFKGIEDLRVTSMTRSAKGTAQQPGRGIRQKAGLNRAVLDNCPGERRRQLAYKCRLYGSELRPVAPFHTSQTCAECGNVDPESRKGCGRLFVCAHCGHEDDADHNASVEIEARARRTGGSVNNSTRSTSVRVPAPGRRRLREAQMASDE